MRYFAGVDVGGTNTKIGILDENADILIQEIIKTESEKGAENTIKRIWQTIKKISEIIGIKLEEIEGIGVGIPGPVVDESTVKIAANFSWGNDFPAKKMFSEITGKKVKIGNDVKVIALGEQLYGAGRGYKNSITIAIGTGIAAGIIIDGKILSGAAGAAGEFGHIVIKRKGHKCGCGLEGCLEIYCSATGIVREAKIILENNRESSLCEVVENNLDNLESYHIFQEAEKGDKVALRIVDEFCENLAHGIGTLLNIVNPEIIIFGGGVSKAGSIMLEGIKKYLPEYALQMTLDNLKFTYSELEESAGIKGAAALIIND